MSGDNLTSTNVACALRKLYGTHPVCVQAAAEIDLLVEALAKGQTTIRHWREECGKLHSQIDRLKADLQAWEITAKRIEEAERPKDVECPSCEGSGEFFRGVGGPDDPERCHVCTGTGIVQRYLDDGSCIRCGAAPRNASGLCATCIDEDAVRAGEIPDMAGVAEQSGAGAPETSVRCGAPAALSRTPSEPAGMGGDKC